MATPPRVAHLLSVPFLAELLAPSYASANRRTADEVYDEVKDGLAAARLQAPLCDAAWLLLKKGHPDIDDASLVELLAKALARKGGVRAKTAPPALLERMSALFASIDLQVDRASDSVRTALATPAGRLALEAGVNTAAVHLVSLFKV